MKGILLVTATAVVAMANGLPAQAGGCYPSLAASVIADSIRGGLTPSQAVQQAANEGNLNSEACLARTIGYMRSMPYTFGDIVK